MSPIISVRALKRVWYRRCVEKCVEEGKRSREECEDSCWMKYFGDVIV